MADLNTPLRIAHSPKPKTHTTANANRTSQNPQMESLLKKYIKEFVTCQMCKSPKTDLHRDKDSRLWNMMCRNCGAQRSCQSIKAGFLAQKKGARKRERLAEGKMQVTG